MLYFLKEHIYSIFISMVVFYMALSMVNEHVQLALFCIAITIVSVIVAIKREWIIRNFWHWF